MTCCTWEPKSRNVEQASGAGPRAGGVIEPQNIVFKCLGWGCDTHAVPTEIPGENKAAAQGVKWTSHRLPTWVARTEVLRIDALGQRPGLKVMALPATTCVTDTGRVPSLPTPVSSLREMNSGTPTHTNGGAPHPITACHLSPRLKNLRAPDTERSGPHGHSPLCALHPRGFPLAQNTAKGPSGTQLPCPWAVQVPAATSQGILAVAAPSQGLLSPLPPYDTAADIPLAGSPSCLRPFWDQHGPCILVVGSST